MVSHKHKCIFIHIPKTGGMSVEKAFLTSLQLGFHKGECAPLLLSYNNNKSIGPVSLAHLSPKEYLDYSYVNQEIFNSYFKFSFVRDPYKRIISIYHHFKYHRIISFSVFINIEFPKLRDSKYYFVKPQVEYLYDEGNLLVDFVGNFENFSKDFEFIQQHVSNKVNNLEHINKSGKIYNVYSRWNLKFIIDTLKEKPYLLLNLNLKKKNYNTMEFFDQDSLNFVNEFYEKDFKTFGYEMILKL